MAEATPAAESAAVENEKITKEAPQLVSLLKEMKQGLDTLRNKIDALTAKVKADHFPTTDGISYLEAKHLLLLNYCQSLVYYLLRKAKGLSIDGHPVVRSLVEIRLFLEKIRPIDKKLQFQLEKYTGIARNFVENDGVDKKPSTENDIDEVKNEEELLKYRPNVDMLNPRTNATPDEGNGVYRPVKFAPTSMDEDKKLSREERNSLRKEKHTLRDARRSAYVRELVNELEERPEEVSGIINESRDVVKYVERFERRAQQEEEFFTRAPLTKAERKKLKSLKKPGNPLSDLTESFYDEIKTLPIGDSRVQESPEVFHDVGGRKFKKQKVI
ncbi:OLC1v1030852C1 [Oldenlandia corymbosa var. corymbosa]|uniref:OLC1v1030852C1 n=1 Tax=Oldenlandia corymbosa var. corymbosa TaxID=529605 RepID=A0AAV1CHU2_OLDCO|nr:OLC1v1030852C1 [Oldenlandia corymbosa var. corymbosa]